MIATYLTILNEVTQLGEQTQAAVTAVVKQQTLPRATRLLKPGSTCRHLYWLETGLVRCFYERDGKNSTLWFATEGEFVTSMHAFLAQQPGHECIELLEPCVLYSISFTQLQTLYRKHPALNLAGRLLTERYYLELEERTRSLQFQTATERHASLLAQQPSLLHRASLGHIASYLGIS